MIPPLRSTLCSWLLTAALYLLTACTPEKPRFHSVITANPDVTASSPARFEIETDVQSTWSVEVDQRAIDTWIEVLDAEGKVIGATDSPSRRGGPERAVFPLPPGQFSIRIHSAEYPGKIGRASVQIGRTDALQRPEDDPWLRAELLETAAATAFRAGTAQDGALSVSSYRQAARQWRELDQPIREAIARYRMAWVSYRMLSDPVAAVADAQYAAGIFARQTLPSLNALSLLLASSARNDMIGGLNVRNPAQALNRARKDIAAARAILEGLRDEYGVAEATQVLAQTEYCAGNYLLARKLFWTAETTYRRLDEQEGASRALVNAAQVDYSLGEFRDAIAAYDRIFMSAIPEANPAMHADMLDNSAHARMVVGDFEGSLRQYLQALQVHQDVHDAGGVGRSLHGIGITYLGLGNPERALEYLSRAVDSRRKTNDGADVVASMLAMGDVHRDLGDVGMAIAIHKDAMRQAVIPEERSRAMLALAQDHVSDRQYSHAGALLHAVLGNSTSTDSASVAAQAHLETGRVRVALGDYRGALPELNVAATTFSRGGAPVREAEALYLIAQARRGLNEGKTAAEYARAALTLAERTRATATNPEFRARFLATRRAIYDLQVNLLLDSQVAGPISGTQRELLLAALLASDLIRARTLSDRVATRALAAAGDGGVPADARRLAEDVAAKEYRLEAISGENPDSHLATSIRADLANLRARYDAAFAQLPANESRGLIPATDPAWRDLPRDTAILVYFISPERSWLWTVTAEGVDGHELPARAVISEAVRQLQSDFSHPSARRQPGEATSGLLRRVSSLLLPPGTSIHTKTSWIVVADGPVASVPFAALYARIDSDQRVIEDHDVAFATTYRAAVRAAHAPITLNVTSDRRPLLFADPVYSLSDKRIEHGQATNNSLQVGVRRLPGTQREVSLIAGRLQHSAPLVLTGFHATREAALSEAARKASVLHFAAHARSDPRRMESAAIQLTGFDREGNGRNGILTLNDLTAASFSADLVVLSACDSALGMEIDGEGSMSVAYGFLSAGAKSVVATQWQVPDAAMVALMDRFYSAAIDERQSVPRALRSAQLELMRGRQWRAPEYWAAASVTLSPER